VRKQVCAAALANRNERVEPPDAADDADMRLGGAVFGPIWL